MQTSQWPRCKTHLHDIQQCLLFLTVLSAASKWLHRGHLLDFCFLPEYMNVHFWLMEGEWAMSWGKFRHCPVSFIEWKNSLIHLFKTTSPFTRSLDWRTGTDLISIAILMPDHSNFGIHHHVYYDVVLANNITNQFLLIGQFLSDSCNNTTSCP